MNILQHHEVEIGDTARDILRKQHGIECTPIVEGRQIARSVSFTSCHYSLFSYVRKSNGQTVWLIEAEFFVPPDALVWRSWVLDAQPSITDMETIIINNVQAGSMLSGRSLGDGK